MENPPPLYMDPGAPHPPVKYIHTRVPRTRWHHFFPHSRWHGPILITFFCTNFLSKGDRRNEVSRWHGPSLIIFFCANSLTQGDRRIFHWNFYEIWVSPSARDPGIMREIDAFGLWLLYIRGVKKSCHTATADDCSRDGADCPVHRTVICNLIWPTPQWEH